MRRTLIVLSALLLFSCDRHADPALDYFPDYSRLKTGYANKFYNHFKPYDKDRESMTRISYSSYKLLDNGALQIVNYNAGFEARGWQYYHFEEGHMHLDSSWYRSGSDTLRARIESGIMKNFADSSGSFYRENYDYENQEHQFISHQHLRADTLIDQKKGMRFAFNRSYRNLDTDSTEQEWEAQETYLEGLGFYHSVEGSQYGIYETELVEQMPISDFEERAQHGEHRVAWIDPDNNLWSPDGFTICGPEDEIADYYNGDPDAEYRYGKKALVKRLKASIDTQKLAAIEGMITYRFVINCEGMAGRFVCQAYDFDYQKMELDSLTRDHILNQLKSLEEWQPTVIRGEKRDAYAYLTFKIKDETIIDILP